MPWATVKLADPDNDGKIHFTSPLALGGASTVAIKSGTTTINDLAYSGTVQIDGTTYYSYVRGVAQAASTPLAAASTSTVLLGAVAAAGLAAVPAAAHDQHAAHDGSNGSHLTAAALGAIGATPLRHDSVQHIDMGLQVASDTASKFVGHDWTGVALHPLVEYRSSGADFVAQPNRGPDPLPFLAATDMPLHPAQPLAAAVIMPSAEMLHLAVQHHQSNEVVGKVLAETLNGGDGPDLDALIAAVGGPAAGGGYGALNALAGHPDAPWAGVEHAVLAGPAHPLQFDLLALHPDSPVTAA